MTQGDVFEEFFIVVSPYVQEDQNIQKKKSANKYVHILTNMLKPVM